MRNATLWFAAALVMGVALFINPASAQDEFDFSVDRYCIDGGPHGAYDGSCDLVDEFNDETLGPTFSVNVGTVTEEADGAMHLKSPGDEFEPFPGVIFYRSEAVDSGGYVLSQSFDAESEWTIDPVEDTYEGTSFAMSISNGTNLWAVGMINPNSAQAAALGIPYGSLQIFTACSSTGFLNATLTTEAVDPSDITGVVIPRINHPTAGLTLTAQISLDGGATFNNFGGDSCTFSGTTSDPHSIFMYADPLEGSVAPQMGSDGSYACYSIKDTKNPKYTKQTVGATDQFGVGTADLKKIFKVCAPVALNGGIVSDPDTHLCCHRAKGAKFSSPRPLVEVVGAIAGTSQVEIKKLAEICEPCSKVHLP